MMTGIRAGMVGLALIAAAVPGGSLAVDPGGPADAYTAEWLFERPPAQALTIEFVRGSVEIIRRPGNIRIAATVSSRTGNAGMVFLVLEPGPEGLVLQDRYRRSAPTHLRECLPPTGVRGYFWGSDARVSAVVHAPASVRIRLDVMVRDAPEN